MNTIQNDFKFPTAINKWDYKSSILDMEFIKLNCFEDNYFSISYNRSTLFQTWKVEILSEWRQKGANLTVLLL